jgi:polyphosphate kinase 2 (PPK2 family)
MPSTKKKAAPGANKKPQNVTNRYYKDRKPISKKDYETELLKLQIELVKMQGWIKEKALRWWSCLKAVMQLAREA